MRGVVQMATKQQVMDEVSKLLDEQKRLLKGQLSGDALKDYREREKRIRELVDILAHNRLQ